jgi:hypothetical protein
LDSATFEICYSSYRSNFGDGRKWNDLAKELGFGSGEILRSQFKTERKKRGLPSKNDLLQPEENLIKPKIEYKSPRVGILDIETLPAETLNFSLYDQDICLEQVLTDVCLLSWAGKFINESEVFSDILTPKEAPVKDTKRIVQTCWDFMSKCDVIVGHNLIAFDAKLMNTFFLKYDMPPLKYIAVDTLLVARNNFRFSSNKLAFINRQLGIREKMSNDGFVLWRRCLQGDKESLDIMLNYNVCDIYATEQLFYKVRPYIRNFNVALFNEINEYQCPVCGSKDLKTEGFYMTSAGKYESVRCQDCKCISRKKENLFTKEKKKSLLINS